MSEASGEVGASTSTTPRWEVLLVVVAALAAGAVVWSGGLWLTNDGPQHLFTAFAALHIDDPALGFSRYFEPHVPPTQLGFRAVFSIVEPFFGWQDAYRLALVVAVELWAFGFLALVRSLSPRRTFVALLGFPTAFQLAFFIGLVPYMMGNAIGMFGIAAARMRQPAWVRAAVSAALFLLAARAHVIGAGVVVAILVFLVLADDRDSLPARLLICAAAALPVAFVFVQVMTADVVGAVAATKTEDPVFMDLAQRTLHIFQVGPTWRGAVAWALLALGAFLATRGRRDERALAVSALVLVALSSTLPRDIIGWQLANVRLAPIGTMSLFALIAVERLSGPRAHALRAVIGIYVVASLAWAFVFARDMRARTEPIVAALGQLTPRPRLLAPAILDSCLGECHEEIPTFEPAFRVAQLFSVVLGGEAAFVQANGLAFQHLVEKPMERVAPPDPSYWKAPVDVRPQVLRRLAIWLSVQEAVLVVGEPQELDVFRRAGYRSELDNGRVLVGTFEGCRGAIEVEGGAGRRVQVGAWPIKSPSHEGTLDENGRLVIEGVPCEDVWLLVEGMTCAGQRDGLPLLGRWTFGENNALRCASSG